MKLFPIVASLFYAITLAQDFSICYQDNCLRAVNGTDKGPNHPITGTSNCRSYMTTTVLADPVMITATVTVPATLTVVPPCPSVPETIPTASTSSTAIIAKWKRQEGSSTTSSAALDTTQGAVPNYATEWCTLEHYSSACRCLGVTTALITATGATVIRTVTLTITQTTVAASCTSVVPSNTTSLSSTSTASFNTTSTVSITFTSGTSTTTTVITLTDPGMSSGTGTGTGTISSGTSVPTIPSSTSCDSTGCNSTSSTSGGPPYANRTTSTSLFTEPTFTTTFPNTTTTLLPTNTTSSAFPSATICGGENVLLCDGTCVESSMDPQNCGGCGIECPTGNTCTNGVCTAPTSCAGSECGNWSKCGADPNTCICAQDEFGSGVCIYRRTPCEALDRCAQTGDCGFGSVCVFSTCCNNGVGGVCIGTTGCLGGGSFGGTTGKRALLDFGQARGVAVDGGALVEW